STFPVPAIPRADPGGSANLRFRNRLSEFRRFCGGALPRPSLDHTCRDHRPDFSATLTTAAFDRSSLWWFGISDLIAESEGTSFVSSTVTHRRRLDRRYSCRRALFHRYGASAPTSGNSVTFAVPARPPVWFLMIGEGC